MLILFPNTLFKKHQIKCKILVYEHPKYFTAFKYHKLKLAMQRAAMRQYYSKYRCSQYVEYGEKLPKLSGQVYIYDPMDFEIEAEMRKLYPNLIILESKSFVLSAAEVAELKKNGDIPINYNFYKWIRLKKDILMTGPAGHRAPMGGKWSFDHENRKPFKKEKMSGFCKIKTYKNKYTEEARKYVEARFSDNPGEINFYLPTTHSGAEKWLKSFIRGRLGKFGPYEDAISKSAIIGYHSAISAMLNNGLLEPMPVIKAILKSRAPIASKEAFVRQILSWREYVRVMYVVNHKKFIKSNFLKHRGTIPKSWYNGTTGLAPIDDCINKALKYAYCHHIERLMILGNFALISQKDPKKVYKWFMELVCIDAYEWVMEPNIYGMSQHSVGKLMMTRPYYASANYIQKMGISYRKGGEWVDIINALYYSFVARHAAYLRRIYSAAPSVAAWRAKGKKEQKRLKSVAKEYL